MQHNIISIVEGLQATNKNGVNYVIAVTNSTLICNQMKGDFEVRRHNRKALCREAKIVADRFQSFTISHPCVGSHRMDVQRTCYICDL